MAARAVRFTLPGVPPVDDYKAEEASRQGLENRTTSRTRIAANRGDNAEEIVHEILREDEHFMNLRKAFWMKFGYEEDVARDLARDEVLTRMRSQVAVSEATIKEEEEEDAGTAKEKAPEKKSKKQKAKEAA